MRLTGTSPFILVFILLLSDLISTIIASPVKFKPVNSPHSKRSPSVSHFIHTVANYASTHVDEVNVGFTILASIVAGIRRKELENKLINAVPAHSRMTRFGRNARALIRLRRPPEEEHRMPEFY
jgi:hypothetical protein